MNISPPESIFKTEYYKIYGTMNTLNQLQVRETLAKLHKLALEDRNQVKPWNNALRFMSVTPEEGLFLNITAAIASSRVIVEFGCSFGISTIYLAAAAKDNQGRVITTEMETCKAVKASAHLQEAGLIKYVEIRVGDALKTLADLDEPIDLLFLDGAKELYLPVFELLKSKLSSKAIIIADNANKEEALPLVNLLLNKKNKFSSVLLFEGRLLLAYCR